MSSPKLLNEDAWIKLNEFIRLYLDCGFENWLDKEDYFDLNLNKLDEFISLYWFDKELNITKH